MLMAIAAGVVAGYALQNYISKTPVLNKVPVIA